MHEKFFKELLKTDQTVFSFKDLLLQYRGVEVANLASKLHYYVQNGDLYHIRRGLYAKDKNYDHFELATKILTPSYVSFESVLRPAGVIFQYSSEIFVASYQSRTIICDSQAYVFKTIKPTVLTNSAGIELHKNYSIATPERAFLDVVYLNKHYHFDNLEPLDWEKVYKILPIYGDNKSMKKRVDIYYEAYKSEIQDLKKVEHKSGMSYKLLLQKCIDNLEKMYDKNIGELLDEKQKAWVKSKLKDETIFLLKLALSNETE